MSDLPPTVPPREESHLPGAPRLPSEFARTERPTPLESLADRVADLSDALHDEGGLVHRLFAELNRNGARREKRAQHRHYQLMRALRHLTNGIAELKQDVSELKREQPLQAARLKVVEGLHRGGE